MAEYENLAGRVKGAFPVDYLIKKFARVVALEQRYYALCKEFPTGIQEFAKWKLASELAGLVPSHLEEPPIKVIEPYAASPYTRFIMYPTETIWRRLATYHSYLMAGYLKPLDKGDFGQTYWKADKSSQVSPEVAREARDRIAYGGGVAVEPKKRRGRPSKAASAYTKALKEKNLAERGKESKSTRRKRKS